MKKITEERINEVVEKAVVEMSKSVMENYRYYLDANEGFIDKNFSKESKNEDAAWIASDFSILLTAQQNFVEALKNVLKELMCDED